MFDKCVFVLLNLSSAGESVHLIFLTGFKEKNPFADGVMCKKADLPKSAYCQLRLVKNKLKKTL